MLKKIALISDIQGNFTALQSVLAQIESESVDQIICLGDIASGAQPHQVVTTLREKKVMVIKGNMDDAILNPHRHDSIDRTIQRYDDMDFWCAEQLTGDDKVFIRSFPPTLTVELAGDMTLLCFHGSPYSYNAVIDETLSEERLKQLMSGYTADIMATGHMHHPFLRTYQGGWLLNPGSVGLPRQQYGKHPLIAEYALISIENDQKRIEFRQVTIPYNELAKGIRESGMPHAEWYLSLWAVDA